MTTEIKFEKDLDLSLLDEIASTPGGEKIKDCIQCGTCSASCPVSHMMDYTPRKIIAMIRAGLKKEVLACNTLWWCVSCYSCTVRCPKNIKITDIMYALKRIAMKDEVNFKKYNSPKLAKSFASVLEKYGRNHEGELIFRYYINNIKRIYQIFETIPTGIKLLKKNRLPFLPKKIKKLEQLKKIIKKANELSEV